MRFTPSRTARPIHLRGQAVQRPENGEDYSSRDYTENTNRDFDTQSPTRRTKSGDPPIAYFLGFDILLPGQTTAQPVELYFHTDWNSSQTPFAVSFRGPRRLVVGPSRLSEFKEEPEPIVLGRQPLPSAKSRRPARADKRWPWWLRITTWFLASLVLASCFPLFVAYRHYLNSRLNLYSESTEQVPGIISFQQPINSAAGNYVTAVLLQRSNVTAVSSDGLRLGSRAPNDALLAINHGMRNLCQCGQYFPGRPDLKNLCDDFISACGLAERAVGAPNITLKHAADMVVHLQKVVKDLETLDFHADAQDGPEVSTEQKRQKLHMAQALQRHVSSELAMCVRMLDSFRYLENSLHQMSAAAPYITDIFEFEGKKMTSEARDNCKDTKGMLADFTSKNWAYFSEILGRAQTGINFLSLGIARLKNLDRDIDHVLEELLDVENPWAESLHTYGYLFVPADQVPVDRPGPSFDNIDVARAEMKRTVDKLQGQIDHEERLQRQ
ncbi:hypothetical protein QBC47DRAFT_409875 [Echria macrotheca]|uniref:Uncharacterized protein n=1 Tax=Echria macrotheca TaxID=438768 RepID=A0AAJ0FES7_9PEZI|nr:hypothetical protein QBC47DRAFT_409875 [Echria macrotheca]